MANLQGFDATEVPEQEEFSAIPKDKYTAIAIESEMKPTKKGTGEYLQFTFEVLDGKYKGRKLWARMNIKNPNPTAQDIGQRELAQFCKAVGVPRPNDSSELHNLPVLLHVDTEIDDRDRESNVVKKFEAVNGGAAQSQGSSSHTARESAPAGAASSGEGDKPWKRRAA